MLCGVTYLRRQAASGQRAAEEHSPVTMPVACRPRMTISDISDYCASPIESGIQKFRREFDDYIQGELRTALPSV